MLGLAWYDAACYALVAVALIGSLSVILSKEGGSRFDDNAIFYSLLFGDDDEGGGGGGMGKRFRPKGHVSGSQIWRCCWVRLGHPGWLLATRLVSLATLAGFLAWDIVDWDASIFIYYTEWTFALVMVYFALGIVMSAYGCWVYSSQTSYENGMTDPLLRNDLEENRSSVVSNYVVRILDTSGKKTRNRYTEEDILQRAGFWGYLMQITYQTSAGAVVLTDIVFWCIIVPFLPSERLGLNLLMGCMHTLNLFFLLVDTSLNSLSFPWFRLSYFVLWSCTYIIFQWVIHACGFLWWPYPFLQVTSPWSAVWYLGMAAAHVPCYGLYVLIVKAKNAAFSRFFPDSFVRS